jgi:hypothetical protein
MVEARIEFSKVPRSTSKEKLSDAVMADVKNTLCAALLHEIPLIIAHDCVINVWYDDGKVLGCSLDNCDNCDLMQAVSDISPKLFHGQSIR